MFACTCWPDVISEAVFIPTYSTNASMSGYLNVWVPIPVDCKSTNIFWL